MASEIEQWQAYREQHWSPTTGWEDDTRWWYGLEAHRLQRTLQRLLAPNYVVAVSPWPAVIKLTVMNEYGSDWPVWGPDGLTDPDDDLCSRLTPQLRTALQSWAMYFCNNYDHERRWEATSAGFHEEGERLCSELARELGPEYRITLNEWTRESH